MADQNHAHDRAAPMQPPSDVSWIRMVDPDARMSRLPRWVHHWYAQLSGYFWLPCPLCRRHSGGHEWRDIDGKFSSIPDPARRWTTQGICPACTRAGRGTIPT